MQFPKLFYMCDANLNTGGKLVLIDAVCVYLQETMLAVQYSDTHRTLALVMKTQFGSFSKLAYTF